MAGKGTYSALLQLKPVKYDVGEYNVKFSDWLIQRGDVKEATRVKQVADKEKAWNENLDKVKIDSIYVKELYQKDQDKMFNDALNLQEQAYRAGRDPNLTDADKQKVLASARNSASQLKEYQTKVGSKEFIKSIEDRNKFVSEKKADMTSDILAQQVALETGNYSRRFDANGNMMYTIPKGYGTNETVEVDFNTINSIYSQLPPPELLEGKDNLYDVVTTEAQKMTKESSVDRNGNVTVKSKAFDIDKGKGYVDGIYGMEFNPNTVNPTLNAFYKRNNNSSNITTEEQFNEAKKGLVDFMASSVASSSGVDTKYTSAQLEEDNLRNKLLREQIKNAKFQRQNSGSSSSGSTTSFVSTLDNGDSYVQIRDKGGKVLGVQNWNINSVSLPKVKGMPASENTFGYSSFKNKKGEIVKYWLMGAPAKDGRKIYSPIPEKDFSEYVSKLGYNPIIVKDELERKESKTNLYRNSMMKKSSYNDTQISFKSKEDNNSNSDVKDAFLGL